MRGGGLTSDDGDSAEGAPPQHGALCQHQAGCAAGLLRLPCKHPGTSLVSTHA